MFNRNILALALAQCFAMTAPAITVLLGSVIGSQLAPRPSLATLPITLMVMGMAIMSYPAAFIMKRIGRKSTFILSALTALSGGLIASASIDHGDFYTFSLACLLIGINAAVVQQYRFAVVESTAPEHAAKALSFLMFGGVFAAYIGPEVATHLSHWPDKSLYAGSFLGLSVLLSGSIICLLFYNNTPRESNKTPTTETPRSLRAMVSQTRFLIAVSASTIAFTVMSMIMTVTPISMHVVQDFTVEETATVIQSHIIAMYLPSLVSAYLITRLGTVNVMILGAAAMLLCSVIALLDTHFMHYWWALVLLGIGWNFLFISGTTALGQTYNSSEKFTAQAINEAAIFGFQAVATLNAGALMYTYGWNVIQYLNMPVLIVFLICIMWKKRSFPALSK